MDKEYRFCYNGTKEMFINHCRYGSPEKKISDHHKGNFQIGNYIISTIDNKLKFGIERTGHSGGNWYIPEIVEYDNRIELVGNIQYIGSKIDKVQGYKAKNKVIDVLLHILVVPFVLIIWCIVKLVDFIKWLKGKISKKEQPVKPKTTEEKLYDLMINYLGCTEISNTSC
ncbi:MAG: hypothetical protein J6K85_02760 [Clostridia bacterium]|nr:hypothetical protein [Clostridia bacterium]